MQKTTQEWLEISEYDLQTAEAMLLSEKYIYVVFMCQQSVEKLLKAIYVRKKNELPPRTHNLLYLLDVLAIKIQEAELLLLSRLNQFYLESRYPGERAQLIREIGKDKARDTLEKTREVLKCLKQQLI